MGKRPKGEGWSKRIATNTYAIHKHMDLLYQETCAQQIQKTLIVTVPTAEYLPSPVEHNKKQFPCKNCTGSIILHKKNSFIYRKTSQPKETKAFGGFLCLILLSFQPGLGEQQRLLL